MVTPALHFLRALEPPVIGFPGSFWTAYAPRHQTMTPCQTLRR